MGSSSLGALAIVTTALALSAPAAAQNVLVNGGFEAPPVLGVDQTDVEPGQNKGIALTAATPWYFGAVSGVVGWTTGLNSDLSSDSGPARQFAQEGERGVFINNWDRRMSQVSPLVVEPGGVYQAQIWILADADAPKAGRFTLVAGEPSPLNPDEFSPTSVVVAEVTAATSQWTQYAPDVTLAVAEWTLLTLEYAAPAEGPVIGRPLTVSFRTEFLSAGPTYWDTASLERLDSASCYADCDESGTLDFFDFLCFQNEFAAGCP